ncbi:MAG: Uncharacterised protein [Prochlorococcus marinus str. MIT 9215]|nr:MAG: Uncharacterised protein [Prochlorococcus marinus str. MIT 9215]
MRFLLLPLSLSLLLSSCGKTGVTSSTRTVRKSDTNINSSIRANTVHQPNEIPDISGLISQLSSADLRLRPRAISMPNGSVRYTYKKRAGEADLTLEEIKQRMQNPINYEAEQLAITKILNRLTQLGVSVVIGNTHSNQAAGTWNPSTGTIKLQTSLVQKGSFDFYDTLSHEAIHVAQSCRSGSINGNPSPLGLSLKYSLSIDTSISHPLYSNDPKENLQMEREAYSHSSEPGYSLVLLDHYCKF